MVSDEGDGQPDEEQGVDRLYGLDPSEFVRERGALAKALAKEDKAAAARVKAMRKPTQAAWAVNVVSRRMPDVVDGLLRAGAAVRQAQEGALAGEDPEVFRERARDKRELIRQLTDEAVALTAESHRDEIEGTLEAAALDDEVGEELRRGRLTRATPRPSGFGVLGDMDEIDWAPPPAADDGEAADRIEVERLERELARADEAVERCEDELRRAERALADAERAADDARASLHREVEARDRTATRLAELQ